jgi:HlyD family secretion protein
MKHNLKYIYTIPKAPISFILSALLASTVSLSACGNKDNAADPSAKVGGTAISKDAGNVSAKDSSKDGSNTKGAGESSGKAGKPALTVMTTVAKSMELSQGLSANGLVAPWQEASVGAEVGGLKLTEVNVNVGDVVRKGQVLATLSPTSVQIDLINLKAQVAEAEANLADAKMNAERGRQLDQTGAISAQQIAQFLTAEKTAQARLDAARSRIKAEELRLSHTKVLASDAGVISARSATLGAVVQPGQELFRLIRQGRLEWRGEITASELSQMKVGQAVLVDAPDLSQVRGKVRMIAPTVDSQTRNALIFVDLPNGAALKSGMLVKGLFELGRSTALTVPQSAILRRDGFSHLFVMESADRVKLVKVETGQRLGDRIEIAKGLTASERFVVNGVGFLNDGDLVRVQGSAKAP